MKCKQPGSDQRRRPWRQPSNSGGEEIDCIKHNALFNSINNKIIVIALAINIVHPRSFLRHPISCLMKKMKMSQCCRKDVMMDIYYQSKMHILFEVTEQLTLQCIVLHHLHAVTFPATVPTLIEQTHPSLHQHHHHHHQYYPKRRQQLQ